MARVLLVGQAPGRRAARPFDGASGRRLERIVGRPLREVFQPVNLLDEWPGKAGKGDAFDEAAAAESAARLRVGVGRTALVCGKAAARALGLRLEFYAWQWWRGARVAVIPHPSGISHYWNDPARAEAAASFIRAVLADEGL